MIDILIATAAFVFGTLIGSFLNVVIYRVPRGESIVFPSSKCQHCQTSLKWYHNIPVFSWLALGGKCAFCHDPIAKQYPIVEIVTGIIFYCSILSSVLSGITLLLPLLLLHYLLW